MPITAAPSAPPKTGRTRTSSASPGVNKVTVNVAPLTGQAKDRSEGLFGWLQFGAVGCIAKGWYADAAAIGIHGEKLCDEIARVGDNLEPLGKVLDILSMTGPYAALMGVALPFVAQIAMNHKMISEAVAGQLEGVQPPAALEAQVRAELAEMQMQAIKAQQEAEAKLAELKSMMNGEGQK